MSLQVVRRRGIISKYVPGNKLLWSPPLLTSPTTWNVTTGDHSRSFGSTEDVIVNLPGTPLVHGAGAGASLVINGGRNVRVIGGEIRRDNVDNTNNNTAVADDHYGIYLVRNRGIVHIEGIHVHGAGMGQAVVIQNNDATCMPTVQIQNCILQPENPTHTNGVHPDGIQIIAGPKILRLYKNTFRSSGTALQMQPYTGWGGWTGPVEGFDFRRLDLITQLPHTDTAPGSYGNSKSASGMSNTPWAEYHEDIYYQENPNHMWAGSPYYACAADTGSWTNDWGAWNPGDDIWPITGEAIKHGYRPGGDLVVAGVNCGIGYVSPGYV